MSNVISLEFTVLVLWTLWEKGSKERFLNVRKTFPVRLLNVLWTSCKPKQCLEMFSRRFKKRCKKTFWERKTHLTDLRFQNVISKRFHNQTETFSQRSENVKLLAGRISLQLWSARCEFGLGGGWCYTTRLKWTYYLNFDTANTFEVL